MGVGIVPSGREKNLRKPGYFLAILAGLTIGITSQAATQTQATCTAYLADNPNPAGIPSVSGAGVAQRSAFLADGGKLVAIGSRYYTVSIPAAFYTATTPVVVFDLHGTGGYPEAEWNDWHASMADRGYAFISLAWGGGAPGAATDTEIYTQLKQILQDVGASCPIASARKWLMGFSVGSAMSFAVMIRDVADQKMFRGQVAVSGAAIGPLTTGKDVMHSTVEANRANANAVFGIDAWMYCGEMDFDHGWSMCTEMPNGESFVNEHGGQAVLYKDPTGTHHSLPTSVAARNEMLNYLVSNPANAMPNYSDSWWNASESGWGITIIDHDTSAFIQWYTYDQTGHNQKYVFSGTFSSDKCQLSGNISQVSGPSWTLPSFDPNLVVRRTTGTGAIDFCPAGLATGTIVFNYSNVDGVTGSKQLTRLPFGDDVPHWGGVANTGAADFTDLWWNPNESGWGVSVTQHGNNLFFRVFVYDTDGHPLLFVASGAPSGSGTSFSGTVTLTTGPWFGSNPFDPNQVVRTATPGNTATLTFSDANNGVLSYTVNGVTKTKTITRMVFGAAYTAVNSPKVGNCPMFSDQHAFNQRVDDPQKYPAASNSDAMMKNIGMFGYMPMFTTVRPMPTTVDGTQPLLPVTCDPAFSWCKANTMIANGTTVPYPQSLSIVSGADHHAFVIQETAGAPAGGVASPNPLTPDDGGNNCYLYETWWTGRIVDNAAPSAQPVTSYTAGSNVTGFTAGGLSVYDLKRDKSYVPAGVAGSSASNLAVAAGQIRYDDFFNSPANVGHAMAVAFPLVRYSYIAPANTAQLPYNCGATAYNIGGAAAANAIKQFPCDFYNANLPAMGQRFRIKASFDETPYLSYPVTLKIIQWGKKWGFIATDGSPVSFGINGDSDPRWQQHMWPDIQQFRNIPISAFEAIQSGPATDMPMPSGVQNHPSCKVYDLAGIAVSGC